MKHRRLVTCLGLAVAVLVWGFGYGLAQAQASGHQSAMSELGSGSSQPQQSSLTAGPAADPDAMTPDAIQQTALLESQKSAAQRRHEAYERLQLMQEGQPPCLDDTEPIPPPPPLSEGEKAVPLTLPTGQNPLVDLNLPNFAYSPNIRKFIDVLPGLGAPLAGSLTGNYIPAAVADTTSYPGTDYYEIALVCYSQKMSSDLPATDLRGYVQIETPVNAAKSKHVALTYPGSAPILNNGMQVFAVDPPSYLGPVIISKRGTATRVKFTNYLPLGAAGNLPVPVDTGVMGAGMGPVAMQNYTQNRADLHLHGGRSPWISDGTTHQWVTPAGENTPYLRGVNAINVPDMPDPGAGSMTYYWTNEQSARLMFYHDHAYGITRLNVYCGEAAGYLITDQVEENLIATKVLPDPLGGLYHYGIPLVIQDKSFVNDATTPPNASFAAMGGTPAALTGAVDPLWYTYVPGTHGGNLWFPHEYMVNENIYDPSGITQMGRWDYGPWMNPPMVVKNNVLPSPTIVPESYLDTPIVNGCAYPTVTLPPTAFRFRILNACNDRMLNLQLYYAEPLTVQVTKGGSGYTAPVVAFSAPPAGGTQATGTAVMGKGVGSIALTNAGSGYTIAPTVTISRAAGDKHGNGAAATAVLGAGGQVAAVVLTSAGQGYSLPPVITLSAPAGNGIQATATATLTNVITSITVTNPGSGYTSAPTVTIADTAPGVGTGATAACSMNTEVKMVPASPDPDYPTWPVDGRPGGVPDPTTQGPPMYQIGNEGGFLANVRVVNPQPVDYDYNRKDVTFGAVTSCSLQIPPAVRADVVVDFSGVPAGSTLILYNDNPAPMPLYDIRNDLFTGCPDLTAMGGAPTTVPGFGPNTRTIMQINIAGTPTAPFNLAALQAALPAAFKADQDAPVVPESAYNVAYGTNNPDIFANLATGDSINVTGKAQPVASIMTTLPGLNYLVPPIVTFAGGGGTGATAVATLNGVAGVTLVTAGSGYTTAPAVTFTNAAGGAGTGAAAVATISGGVVTAITITNPGSNYLVAPTVTIAAPAAAGGVAATATANVTLNSVGAITLTNPGTGYLTAPQVFLTAAPGDNGQGAAAVAMLNGALAPTGKGISEGFDPEYGRMYVVLGSTPNPLTPNVGTGPVIGLARYMDPPTEILTPETPVLWKITHIGVDSHALHFHLFDVQVINRVDWANIVKPPYEDEQGWKDTIRTNPFEDIYIALRPTAAAMRLPFGIPQSNRLLDVTTPAGSTVNFMPVAPPIGVPAVAQLSNVMTNFGWEYVFHCHLLGHEENDMMRPMCFMVPSTAPAASTVTVLQAATSASTAEAQINWTDPTPYNYVTHLPLSTQNNPRNETGFLVEKATGAGGAFATLANVPANTTTIYDSNVVVGTTYRYRVTASNAAGSAVSNAASVTMARPVVPAAPTNLVVAQTAATTVTMTCRDNATNETSFLLERADNGGAFAQIATLPPATGTGTTMTYADTWVVPGSSYVYRITAVSGVLTSAAVTSTAVVIVQAPAAPTNLTATAVAGAIGRQDTVTLKWTDNATNETAYQIQRATNAAFTAGLNTTTAAANAVTASQNVTRRTTFWYRVAALNGTLPSAYSNVISITTP